ncbi:MAG: S9 family peptidase [Chloroflexota bacterium]
MLSETKRRLTAEDLYRFHIISDPQISPDGRQVIFCDQTVDPKTEKKYSHLWLVPADGSRPVRQFTYGKQQDSQPRWSPDGSQIAFLSNRGDEKQAQIYLLPLDGGEARPLTTFSGSIANFEWSPDGKKLACQFRQKDPAASEREKDEQKKKLGIVERHITGLDFRADGAGYLPQEKWHIWLVDADSGEAKPLTAGSQFHEGQPRWSPDGADILFLSNRAEQPDVNWDRAEFYLIAAGGGEMRQVVTHNGRKFAASFSPNGRYLAFQGRDNRGSWYQNDGLYVVSLDGGETVSLSGPYDLHCGLATLTDTGSGSAQTPPIWSADGAAIYNQVSIQGSQPVLRFGVDAAAPQAVVEGAGIVGAFSVDKAVAKMAYLWGSLEQLGQIWLLDLATGEKRQLTHFNEDLLAEIDLGYTEEVWFKAADGADLHGWITFPPEFDPAQTYPSVLEIHGGPLSQYGRSFMHEFYFLAAQGYVVYWSNPRGGLGYGAAHAQAIENAWGTVDYDDVMAWADYLAQQPFIDPERMGVTGGSYGGFMTTLIIGKTDRFKTAVAQRVVSNLISFYGASDLNAIKAENLVGLTLPPWEDLDNYWAQSPMKYIGGAKTPTLVIHSEQDMRCPEDQGIQVFTALKRLGVPTELVLFPEESHGLSRAGRTDRRVARLHHIRRWLDSYLK